MEGDRTSQLWENVAVQPEQVDRDHMVFNVQLSISRGLICINELIQQEWKILNAHKGYLQWVEQN